MTKQAILVRAGALTVALAIAGAIVWSYGMTATIIGHYMSRPDRPPPRNDGVVDVSVLPAPAAPPSQKAARPQ